MKRADPPKSPARRARARAATAAAKATATKATAAKAKRRTRLVWPLLASVAFVGFLFLFVFPTRTFLSQRTAINRAEEQLDVLQRENAALEARIDDLNTDAAIERLAREQYNLVRPGEEAYAILPAPPPRVTIPDIWPFHGLQARLDTPR